MIRISIPNMTCGGCAKGVLATLREAAPEAAVAVDLANRRVEVSGGETASLVAALRADGWEATAAP